jgi:hypothetical protein
MFIAALVTIAKIWKQPRYPLPINGLRKCGNYTQWNFIQPQGRMKFLIHRKVDGTGKHHLTQS